MRQEDVKEFLCPKKANGSRFSELHHAKENSQNLKFSSWLGDLLEPLNWGEQPGRNQPRQFLKAVKPCFGGFLACFCGPFPCFLGFCQWDLEFSVASWIAIGAPTLILEATSTLWRRISTWKNQGQLGGFFGQFHHPKKTAGIFFPDGNDGWWEKGFFVACKLDMAGYSAESWGLVKTDKKSFNTFF